MRLVRDFSERPQGRELKSKTNGVGIDPRFRGQLIERLDPSKRGSEPILKILLAADGSKYTARAVNYLIKHRTQFGDGLNLVLLHVRMPIPGRAASALGREVVAKYYADESRKAMALARRKLERARLPFAEVHRLGDPGGEIARYAIGSKCDLVLMGSHGHGMLTNLVLGSCTSKVLARCKVPVLVIR